MDSPYGLHAGTLIGGDFEVVRPLGSGGMGSVYLCRQHSTARERAVKVMHPVRATDPEERRRFEREARAPGLIGSPHIVEVLIAGVDAASGLPYLAMELLHGETLSARVEQSGPLPIAEARRVLEQLGRALEAAHDAGIVHRDLKPENVFLEAAEGGAAPRVKLLDFGIAKVIADARTSTTGALGTPLWMAPEQAHVSYAALPQSDVWAYGLVAFFALAGQRFWRGRELPALLREVLIEPIPAASRRAAELGLPPLPAGFDVWFSRCVERDPFARFTSAAPMWPALDRLLDAALDAPAGAAASLAAEARRRGSSSPPAASAADVGAEERPAPVDAYGSTITFPGLRDRDERTAEAAEGGATGDRRGGGEGPAAAPGEPRAAGAPRLEAQRADALRADALRADALRADALRPRSASSVPPPTPVEPRAPGSAAPPRGLGGGGTERPLVHALDDAHCIATWNGVLFQIWRGRTTEAAVRGVRRVLREHGGQLQATLVILEEHSMPAGPEVRSSLAELSRELAAHGMCAALVLEDHGFRASLMRNVAIEFILLSRTRLRYEVFSAMKDAFAWLMRNRPRLDWLRELPAVTEALRRDAAAHGARAASTSLR
ncbi:protein kinase domain-containing protein [Sorangium sp. So ce385]|uniref:serine/threonine-protein kinase n=1 Tax=Sorangium sp. So ce385 TaxID=3133308 RepID=UPI003F5B6A11